mmetsp:Transcript_26960/g.31359  ORF Transcript_26960/g.31359 Transcript_26960/m.31359 type:complete len:252 (-) Transcript_26960:70-825(-)
MAMKRKGEEYATSPVASVVFSSPPSQYNTPSSNINVNLSSSLSILSPFSPASCRPWEETREAMEKVLYQFQGLKSSNDYNLIKETSNVIERMEGHVNVLKEKSTTIKDRIQNRIEYFAEQCNSETEKLEKQQQKIDEFKSEVDTIRDCLSNLLKEEKEMKARIDEYKIQASQEVEQIDEVEEEKKVECDRLRNQISMYAVITGIKWDYDTIESIAGEVEIPSKGKHVRFEIDPEQYSPFEVTNMLWDKIGG